MPSVNPSRAWKLSLELLVYAAATACFFALRTPLLPYWWTDFNSDFALVGVMAQHTLEGHFPIYYYGQNYMGGLEWLTAALGAKLAGSPTVSMEILRWNDLLWWFAASAAWVLFLRRISALLGIAAAGLFAFGNFVLLWSSVVQELTPEYVFFGALITWALWAQRNLLGRRGFFFGALLGLAWWTNQSVVFFFLPALWVFHAEPENWLGRPIAREFLRPVRGLRWVYGILAFLFLLGVGIALAGGLLIPLGKGHLKIPNGLSLAKTAFALLLLFQLIAKLRNRQRPEFRAEAWKLILLARYLALGFFVGYAPVWLGRIFHLYEKSYGVGLAILPVKEWGAQAVAFAASMDTVLYSSLLHRTIGNGAGVVTWATLVGWVGFAWWQRRDALVRFGLYVFLLNGAYVFFSSRAQGAPTRYLYASLIGAWLIALVPAATHRRWSLRVPATLMLMSLGALGSWWASSLLTEYTAAQEWRRDNIQKVLHEVESRGFRRCWGDYWTGYMLTYLSGERIIFSSHPQAPDHQMRVPAYHRLVEEAKPACFVYRKPGDNPLGALMFSETNPWAQP